MSIDTLLPFITGGSGALVVLTAWVFSMMSGKLHTDAEMKRADDTIKQQAAIIERQAAAQEKSDEALAETRRALAEASARGDAAIRSSELIAGALGAARGRRSGHAT